MAILAVAEQDESVSNSSTASSKMLKCTYIYDSQMRSFYNVIHKRFFNANISIQSPVYNCQVNAYTLFCI